MPTDCMPVSGEPQSAHDVLHDGEGWQPWAPGLYNPSQLKGKTMVKAPIDTAGVTKTVRNAARSVYAAMAKHAAARVAQLIDAADTQNAGSTIHTADALATAMERWLVKAGAQQVGSVNFRTPD